MSYGLWLSAAGLQASEYRQAVVANNLANINTVGFKHDLAVLAERRVESQTPGGRPGPSHAVLDGLSGGTWVRPTYHSFEPGAPEPTGNPLDLAAIGTGREFFPVSDGDEVRYTRDGRFTLNDDYELVMVAGQGRHKLLDEVGLPIVLPGGEFGPVDIDANGFVVQDGAIVGRIAAVEFADTSKLRKVGENLFDANDTPHVPSDARLMQGHVERSTVDPIAGLTQMIEVSRAYQLNATMIQLQDQLTGQAVQTVGRIG